MEQIPLELQAISEKIFTSRRLTIEEGMTLLSSPHLSTIQQLANWKRENDVGKDVYFATTLYIHPTNLCELSCPMCSFYAKPGWKTAWMLTPEMIETKIRDNLDKDINEIHVVGGLWRECNLDYYQDVFTRIKNIDPNLHIKALTPVEYDFLSRIHGITIEEVFEKMMSWGLGSLPGGGAEILVEEIRKKIAPGKITSDEYLNVHRIAHKLGLKSNITMLYGHIEDDEHIITHLDKLRCLQDETKGFQAFVPLKYHIENNALGKRQNRLKPKDIERIYPVSRLMLDNIPHIKVLWNYIGIDAAKKMLDCGVNDFGSTSIEEKIITMAGGVRFAMTEKVMADIIIGCGKNPVKIHSGYPDACLR